VTRPRQCRVADSNVTFGDERQPFEAQFKSCRSADAAAGPALQVLNRETRHGVTGIITAWQGNNDGHVPSIPGVPTDRSAGRARAAGQATVSDKSESRPVTCDSGTCQDLNFRALNLVVRLGESLCHGRPGPLSRRLSQPWEEPRSASDQACTR
jgi:hypothetical protein